MKPRIISSVALLSRSFLGASLLFLGALPLSDASGQSLRQIDRNEALGSPVAAGSRTTLKRRARPSWLSEDIAPFLRLSLGPEAVTGPSTWIGGSGNWSDAAMWDLSGAPNSADADVSIDNGNLAISAVTLDVSATVGRLTIDAGDSLNIIDNRTLSLTDTGGFTGAGSIVNNGALSITSGGNATQLSITGAVSLTGSGAVTLVSASNNNALIRGGGTLTNSSTIQGQGNVGANEMGLVNQSSGIIQANVSGNILALDPNSAAGLSNAGMLRATGGGILQLSGNGGGDFVNTSTGRIEAQGTGSEVQLLNSARISGGTLATSGGGLIRTANSNQVFLNELTNSGDFLGGDNSTTVISGTITNTGNIRLLTAGNSTNLRIDTAATLTGTGTITLDRDPNSSVSNSRISGAGTLTNQTTIQGEGNVGANETTLINQSSGIIQANVTGRVLTLDPNASGGFSNGGVLRATGGGILQLTGNGAGDFTNTGSGNILADGAGSEVQLINGATIHNGTLTTANGGLIRALNSQTVFLDGLSNTGNFLGSDNSTTVLSGTINNTGNITITTDGNFTRLRIDDAATLAGAGTVTLTRNAMVTGASNARIDGSGTLTNQSTIQGEGFVGGNSATIVNTSTGRIQANVSGRVLQVDSVSGTGTFANQGLLRALDGGILQLTGNGGGTFDNTGGIIRAEAGSEVQLLNGVTISGGTLSTLGAGAVLRALNSNTVTLDNLTIAGTYTGSDNSTTILTGAINNTGDITITSDGNFTNLRVNGTATLQAGGTVTLTRDAAMTGASNARIDGVGALTNASTIQGEGTVASNQTTIINQSGGIIQANVLGRALLLDAASVADSFNNAGVLRALNGGLLQFTGNGGGDFNNNGAGSILADGAGSEVQLMNSAIIHGGTLSTANGGVIRTVNSNTATLDSLTNTGNYIGSDNSTTILQGTINNTGNMSVTTDGNFTRLRIDGAVALTGNGTVTLTRNALATGASNARIEGSGTLTNSSTIQGEGSVGVNETTILNQLGGVIQANVNGRTLTLDAPNNATGIANAGTLRASNGGTLLLTGNGAGAFSNNIGAAGGIFEVLDGSAFTLDSSAILTNNVSGVLTLGSYRANSSGNGATLTIRGGNITELAANTEVILSGAGSVFQVGTTALESSLLMNNGALRILAGRNYSNVNNLTSAGVIQLGGGILDAPLLTISASGELFGFGTVTPRPTNSGLIRAVGGTLSLTNGIQGGSGTVQIDSSGVLNLSSSSAGSSADFLIHNGSAAGSLNLGAQNFVVGLDYTNANFGSGNSFNPRANLTGAGLIVAAGNVAQTLGGNVTGGASANAIMAFGNVHVGDMPTLNYQINNTGTNGPVLRGALQTAANGGNITDGRLTGAGVTASNFGPIGLGANTGNLGVTFNASSAGALNGQTLHLINNFSNVGDQNLSITGAAYRYANPSAHLPAPVNLGNFHVGDANPSIALSMTNNVPADGFSEALNAVIGGATGGVIASGSFNLLAPGATNNSSLMVGFSTANAGNQSGTATISLQSDGTGSSGLGITNLASQIVNLTGGVYRYAAPVVNTPLPIVFANSHVGDVVAQALSVTNNAPNDTFSERLDAGFTGTSGNATASGSFALLGAGATNAASLMVGLDTSVAGIRAGTATIGFTSNGNGTSGLGSTALPGQIVNVSGGVYRYANPTAAAPAPVSFGVVHVGESVSGVVLSMSNNVANDGFSESLNASIGGGTNGVTASGSFNGLAPGATNNTSLTVGINTTSAGSRNGTATISLQSNGAGSSGLGLSALPSQSVNVTGQVNFYADPIVILQSGSASLIMNSASVFTLDFGQVAQDSGVHMAALGLLNTLHDAVFQDALGGAFDVSAVTDFLLNGFGTFANIAPGSAFSAGAGFDSAQAVGSYDNSLVFNPTSANASSTTPLGPIQLNLHAEIVVVPEPSTFGLLAGGALLLALGGFRRRRA